MIHSQIKGVMISPLDFKADERGWLVEIFRRDEMDPDNVPVMSYLSLSRPGVIRGPHEHQHQTDLFYFISPINVELHLWDNRMNSETYNVYEKLIVKTEEMLTIQIPPGVVHGYKNASQYGLLVINFPNRLYKGEGRRDDVDEIRYEDYSDTKFRIE